VGLAHNPKEQSDFSNLSSQQLQFNLGARSLYIIFLSMRLGGIMRATLSL
jgi:hypothetical protein